MKMRVSISQSAKPKNEQGICLLSHDVRNTVSGSKPILVSVENTMSTAVYEHYLIRVSHLS